MAPPELPATWNEFGFGVWNSSPAPMARAHQHGEIELNLLLHGQITYLFGGQWLTLETGQLALFWGSFPHRLSAAEPGSRMAGLTLPLLSFLRFGLPPTFSEGVLRGGVRLSAADVGDAALLARWEADAASGERVRLEIAELELEARLKRLALAGPLTGRPVQASGRLSRAAELARYAAAHASAPLSVSQISAASGLHVNYASTLFREVFGLSLGEYVLQHRLAHAQRLLLTTRRPVLETALEAGFGSVSRFYAAFGKACGVTPLAYRRGEGVSG
ncbi:helix-turn-helix domain-containing protein [Deinococcus alpinitundrae]|uniref:helix-turn-helix domain-containing protein n=1 Tax=Deinococcus alpinitundrae TaxID=468913 RepID=UPI001379AF76|nr:helix-turn-helix domain-containing protein [Deinococcus alpinitundrae]